ncbi:hypothetical protein OG871_08280 [Kitasatospora sp. NBC_00374]|uniref:hypothetical protein n=1 Tax=Kitasatospora sp. NBC_00374 TaxID=2975964 RepID=UPI0030E36F2D
MVRRTPQEKKRLSCPKDRRGLHGENDKSSRRNVPRARQDRHQELRRTEQPAPHRIRAYGGTSDDSETRFRRRGTGEWRKWPDFTPSSAVEHRLRRRVERGGTDGAQAAERIARIRRRLGVAPGAEP